MRTWVEGTDVDDAYGYDEVVQHVPDVAMSDFRFGNKNVFLQGPDNLKNVFTFAQTSSIYSNLDGRIRYQNGKRYRGFMSGADHQLEKYRESYVFDPNGVVDSDNFVTGTQNGYIYPRRTFPYEGNPPRKLFQKARMHLSSTIISTGYEKYRMFNHNSNILHYVSLTAFTNDPDGAASVATDPHGGVPNIWHQFARYNNIREMMWGTGWDYPGQWRHGVRDHCSHHSVRNSVQPKADGGYNFGAKGMLYGLKNYHPEKTTAVFRRDSFGQFRDMLEQRDFSTFYTIVDHRALKGLRTGNPRLTRRGRRNRLETGPIVCRFVSASDGVTLVDPKDTSCSNISIFATSSLPFIEGKSTNSSIYDGTRYLQNLVMTDTPILSTNEEVLYGEPPTESSGGGGTVICTELFRQGMLTKEVYDADDEFGRLMSAYNNTALLGYRIWAAPIARKMKTSQLLTTAVSKFAIPWANQMAHEMGAREKGSTFGKILMIIGIKFSSIVYMVSSSSLKKHKFIYKNLSR